MARKAQKLFTKDNGPYEILPEQVDTWDHVVSEIRGSLANTGYQKMVSPLTEKEDLFTKDLLESLHIIDKNELFTVRKKGKNSLVLSAPGPVSLIRTAIEQGLVSEDVPAKLYHYGMSLVDEDNDDATDPKQFHVFKIECIGDSAPVRDAEIILTAYRILEDLGLKNLVVNINSLGTKASRQEYYTELCNRAGKRFANLCERYSADPIQLYSELQAQSTEMNIALPFIVDHLDEVSAAHFKVVLEFLDTLEVPYEMNPMLRGSLGFNESVYFEIVSQDNPDVVLVRGGRHDSIYSQLGGEGEHIGSVGMEIYVDTVLARIWKSKQVKLSKETPQVFVASIGQEGQKTALKILSQIQKKGLGVKESFGIQSLKQQLSKAKKVSAPITLIIGRKESIDGTVILRDRFSDNQETVPLDRLLTVIEEKLAEDQEEKI